MTDIKITADAVAALETMYALFNKSWTDGEVILWNRFLAPYSDTIVIAAIEKACETSTYMPKPREVLTHARQMQRDTEGPKAQTTQAQSEWRSTLEPMLSRGEFDEFRSYAYDMAFDVRRQLCVTIERWCIERRGQNAIGTLIMKFEAINLERTDSEQGFYLFQYIDDVELVVAFTKGELSL